MEECLRKTWQVHIQYELQQKPKVGDQESDALARSTVGSSPENFLRQGQPGHGMGMVPVWFEPFLSTRRHMTAISGTFTNGGKMQ